MKKQAHLKKTVLCPLSFIEAIGIISDCARYQISDTTVDITNHADCKKDKWFIYQN